MITLQEYDILVMFTLQEYDMCHLLQSIFIFSNLISWEKWHMSYTVTVGRYGPVMTDSSRLQQHHTTSDDPGQGCKAHEGGIRP